MHHRDFLSVSHSTLPRKYKYLLLRRSTTREVPLHVLEADSTSTTMLPSKFQAHRAYCQRTLRRRNRALARMFHAPKSSFIWHTSVYPQPHHFCYRDTQHRADNPTGSTIGTSGCVPRAAFYRALMAMDDMATSPENKCDV